MSLTTGPPPKKPEQRRRRNATVPMVQLPAEGRKGRTPKWPLAVDASGDEMALWRELWRTPMAVAWQRFGYHREVAQYARLEVAAEHGDLDAAKEARQRGDRLGMTPLSLLRLRWEVVADEVSEQRGSKAPAKERPRLRAVDPAATG